MTRSSTHLVAALAVWSSFYGGLAALGVRPGADAAPPVAVRADAYSGCAPARARHEPARGAHDPILRCERVLATSDDVGELGIAIREAFEHHRCLAGDEEAFDRVCQLVERNRHVASATVDRPYVHLEMVRPPDLAFYFDMSEPDCSRVP